ncbi:MAG TPA: GDYXXLXY domain-containing protein [Vicinamibacterales bacterium]|nr:GDYXXLXY domain-containing protein [Vicinamibacterales bacterium]
MHKLLIAAGGILVLAVANIGIWQKQQIVESGRVVMLELAPVDPRSLMQGDYMALRFKVANDAFRSLNQDSVQDGRLILSLDDRNVGSFSRFDDGGAVAAGEVTIRYRVRGGTPRFATNAYFFQEGTADLYTTARFGEFRVSPAGDAILTRLRNDKLVALGPGDR